jgi:hypothetical protein
MSQYSHPRQQAAFPLQAAHLEKDDMSISIE